MTMAAARIVSLVPSLTELLCELGLAEQVVGRTGFCIHPREQVARIAKVGGTKTVNLPKVRALKPTHLVVNIDENEKPTVEALRPDVGEVVVTHPITVDDNRQLIASFGERFGVQDRAAQWIERFDAARAALREEAARHRPQRVMYLIWKDPWMTVGPDTFIAHMLREAGWSVWAPSLESNDPPLARYPSFDWDAVDWTQVDRVLASSEPYRFTPALVQAMAQSCPRPVHLIDGEMTSWYGTRVVEGFTYLRDFLKDCAS
jgi:hypothetical protein